MFSPVEEFDRAFKSFDALLRLPQEPIGSRHIRVYLSEHERRRTVADDLNSEIEILQRLLAAAFLVITDRDLAIGFRHPKPIPVVTIVSESTFRMIAADRAFIQLAVNACESG